MAGDGRRLLLKLPQVVERAGLSRSTIYELIASGEIPVVRIGRAVRVPAAALEAWVERLQNGTAQPTSAASR